MGHKMMTVIPALFASVLVGGCQTSESGYFATSQEVAFTVDGNHAVAADMAVQLKRIFKPAVTTFWMPAAVARKSFGQALDEELRNDGYAIRSKPPGIELAYVVDAFGNDEVRVRVVAGEDYETSRLYSKTDDGELAPEGCFTERSEPLPDPKPVTVHPWATSLQSKAVASASQLSSPLAASCVPAKAQSPAPKSASAAAVRLSPAKTADAKPLVDSAVMSDRVPPSLTDPKYSIVGPDSDNVIALNENLFVAPVQATDNPFLQLYQPPYKPTDRKLVVSAAVGGPHPTCIVDGAILGEGDRISGGPKVYRIDPDEIYLERGNFLLKCPVSNLGVTLRLP
jgi:hypothetical protein